MKIRSGMFFFAAAPVWQGLKPAKEGGAADRSMFIQLFYYNKMQRISQAIRGEGGERHRLLSKTVAPALF
jgi:hypothetical protein